MFQIPAEIVRLIWSEVYLTTLILGALCLLFLFYRLRKGEKLNLPPGPFCLPIVGYYPFLGSEPHKLFYQLSKKYGNVFRIYLGRIPIVVIGDFPAMKEAFSLPTTIDRPPGTFSLIPNAWGFASMNGKEWFEQRRYSVKAMRDLGLVGSRWEAMVQDEVDDFIKVVADHNGSPMDVNKLLISSVTNSIITMLMGIRLPMGHATRGVLERYIHDSGDFFGVMGFHNYFPWIVNTLVKLGVSRYAKVHKEFTKFDLLLKELVEKWKKSNDGNENYISGYFEEIKRNGENKLSNTFNEENLRGNLQILLTGGSHTIRTSLNWSFLVMARFQDIQRKVQEELDSVLGREGKAQWRERSKLPYTTAVMLEGLRWESIVSLNSPRVAMEDIKICGYDIPKGTTILANFWSMHHDPNFWKNPEEFDPNRFLSEDRRQVNFKPDSYAPFSVGKRNCPGDVVAYIEIFHYFSSALQRFDVLPPEGEQPKFEGFIGLTFQAVAQNLRFIPRE